MQRPVDEQGGTTSAVEAPPRASRGLSWVIMPVVAFAGLVALFAFALTSGDPSRLPSALIGKPVPSHGVSRARRAARCRASGAWLHQRRPQGRRQRREFLGGMVRRMRGRAGAAVGPESAGGRAHLRRQLQGRRGGGAPLPRPLRQSVQGGRHRQGGTQRDRVGRLRDARDVRHQRARARSRSSTSAP